MAEVKHTLGEWIACENDPDGMDYDKIWITTDARLYHSLVPIAEVGVDYSEPMNAEQRANAEFIAHAVNCHADMLAALRECQAALAMMVAPNSIDQTTVVNAFAAATAADAKARSAIAKAEGR